MVDMQRRNASGNKVRHIWLVIIQSGLKPKPTFATTVNIIRLRHHLANKVPSALYHHYYYYVFYFACSPTLAA